MTVSTIPWPETKWPTSTPEAQGMESELLARACESIREKRSGIHSLLIIRNGKAVLDAVFHPFTPRTLHDIASCTKSITSTLIGIAIDRGLLSGVEERIVDLFPKRNIKNLDELKRSLTVKDLLTMRPGLKCHYQPGEITLREMLQSPDWTQFVLDLPMIEPPGVRFEYCSPASHLLAAVIHQISGASPESFARQNLFEPLGISGYIWPVGPQGTNHGWGDLKLYPHDMARLGYCFLNKGEWNGRRIVSPEWIADATRKHAKPSPDHGDIYGYGYQWWLASDDIFYADGRGGQMIIVEPGSNLVAVITAGLASDDDQTLNDLLFSFVVPSIKSDSPLKPNNKGCSRLKTAVEKALEGVAGSSAAMPLPTMAGELFGHAFQLDDNPLRIRGLQFEPAADGSVSMWITVAEEIHQLPVGLDGVDRFTPRGRFDLPASLRGDWREGVFTIHWDEIGNINKWKIDITVNNGQITLNMKESSWHSDLTIQGRCIES